MQSTWKQCVQYFEWINEFSKIDWHFLLCVRSAVFWSSGCESFNNSFFPCIFVAGDARLWPGDPALSQDGRQRSHGDTTGDSDPGAGGAVHGPQTDQGHQGHGPSTQYPFSQVNSCLTHSERRPPNIYSKEENLYFIIKLATQISLFSLQISKTCVDKIQYEHLAILADLKSCQFAPRIVIFNLCICCQFDDSQIILPKLINI